MILACYFMVSQVFKFFDVEGCRTLKFAVSVLLYLSCMYVLGIPYGTHDEEAIPGAGVIILSEFLLYIKNHVY